jgi:PPM family protein phosphatase
MLSSLAKIQSDMNNINLSPRVQSFVESDKGRRSNNEDYVTFYAPENPDERRDNGCVYIVADGVGGASKGERASSFATKKVLYEYQKSPKVDPAIRLKQAIIQANHEIFEYAESRDIRMATTMAVAVVIGTTLIVANVGDSRVYLIRNKEVQQITRDHNIVGELVRDNVMTEEEALRSKAKNKLTRSIGGNDEVHVDVFGPIELLPDDRIFLCSDGLTRYTLKKDIARLTDSGSPEQIVKDAIAFAKKQGHGGADNISVIAVVYEPTGELDATKKINRTKSPEESWEIIDTVLMSPPPKGLSRTQGIIIAFLVLMIMVLGGVAFYFYGDIIIMQFTSAQNENPTQTEVVNTENVFPTSPITVSPEVPFINPFEPPILTSIPSVLSSPTFSELPATSEPPTEALIECVYTVIGNDTLFGIADKFGIGGNNWKVIMCDGGEGNTCDTSSPGEIQPGWRVVVPRVEQSVCELYGIPK